MNPIPPNSVLNSPASFPLPVLKMADKVDFAEVCKTFIEF